jgi:glycosyltransferase involved in cell wall biosynthesis
MSEASRERLRLGILSTHPIQYQAPLFRELARKADVSVYFAHRQTPKGQAEAGFGVAFEWDVPLLDGYDHRFLENVASDPSPLTFRGCDTPEIGDIIQQESFDAFLVGGWFNKSYLQAIFACRRAGVPLMVRGDSQLQTPRSKIKTIVKELLYRRFFGVFDRCLYVGERSREYYRHYGVDDRRLVFSPHFVDNEFFERQARKADRAEVLRELGRSDEQSAVILFVGKFIPEKAPIDILHAASQLQRRGRSVTCLFVGGGPMEDRLRQEAAALGVWTVFAGFKNQSELPAIYNAADVLVLPSVSETWGLVVNEAFACGLPAVVSKGVGCAPDLIVEGRTGASFNTGDTACFADALERVLRTNPEISKRETKSHIARYSVEAAAEGVIKAAHSLRYAYQNVTS